MLIKHHAFLGQVADIKDGYESEGSRTKTTMASWERAALTVLRETFDPRCQLKLWSFAFTWCCRLWDILHGLVCLNTSSPAGDVGKVMESLEGGTLLEGVCPHGAGFGFAAWPHFLSILHLFSAVAIWQDHVVVLSQCFSHHGGLYRLQNCESKWLIFLIFSQQQRHWDSDAVSPCKVYMRSLVKHTREEVGSLRRGN